MIPLIMLAVIGFCAGDPDVAAEKFRDEYQAALVIAAPGTRVLVATEIGLPWKAVTYIAPVIGLRTTVRVEWLCAATDEEIVHVARHEACHVRLHKSQMERERQLSDNERMKLEHEAEFCVMFGTWEAR